MAKYLIRTVETYRVGTEAEAQALINEAKKDRTFTLAKYASEKKQVKKKGEIEDEWVRTTLTKDFNIEKEPDTDIEVTYSIKDPFLRYAEEDED